MKKVQSKILLFLTAAVLFSTAAVLCFSPSAHVSAFAEADASDYVSGGSEIKFADDNLVVTVKKDDKVKFKNPIVVNDLALELSVPTDAKKVTLSFTTESFDPNADDVKHELVMENNAKFEFDGAESADVVVFGYLTLYIVAENNELSVAVGASEYVKSTYGKIGYTDKCVVTDVAFAFDTDVVSDFAIKSVDQGFKTSTSANGSVFKQTFKLDESNALAAVAKPRIGITTESVYVCENGTYKPVVRLGVNNSLSFKAYSFTAAATSSSLGISDTEATITTAEYPTEIMFTDKTKNTFKVGEEKFTFNVYDGADEDESSAPRYKDYSVEENRAFVETFKAKLQEATVITVDDQEYSVRLGGKVKVPSMKALVSDDYTAYSALSHTLYYKTPQGENSTTGWEIPISYAGDYLFYVVFSDAQGNSMEADDFKTAVDGEDDKVLIADDAKYVFGFHIEDDAPLGVKAATSQTKGYKGVAYKASAFTFESTSYNKKYELFYTSNSDAEFDEDTWTLIADADSLKEDDFDGKNVMTYDEAKEVAYDGELSFVPVKTGKYVIRCTVTADASVKSATAKTEIKVVDEPQVVKPDNHWLQNNVWSVVFLSIGTLCLVAIIALLFVKPKDVNEED